MRWDARYVGVGCGERYVGLNEERYRQTGHLAAADAER